MRGPEWYRSDPSLSSTSYHLSSCNWWKEGDLIILFEDDLWCGVFMVDSDDRIFRQSFEARDGTHDLDQVGDGRTGRHLDPLRIGTCQLLIECEEEEIDEHDGYSRFRPSDSWEGRGENDPSRTIRPHSTRLEWSGRDLFPQILGGLEDGHHPGRYMYWLPGPWVTCHPRLARSEEHTSELQSRGHLVCRL